VKKIVTYTFIPFVLAITMILVSLLPIACNHGGAASCQPTSIGCVIIGSLVDCTGVNSLDSAVALETPVVIKLINSARNADGSVNWTAIQGQLEQIAWQYGVCVIADIWNTLMNSPSGSGGSATALQANSSPPLDPKDLKQEFDRIRAHVMPGYAIKLKSGGTL